MLMAAGANRNGAPFRPTSLDGNVCFGQSGHSLGFGNTDKHHR
jgi:hypothetical protein